MLKQNTEYKVQGYYNKWSVIDKYRGHYLLENTTYGDETCYLVVEQNCSVENKEYTKKSTGETVVLPTITSKVYETYDSIEICLQDEGII